MQNEPSAGSLRIPANWVPVNILTLDMTRLYGLIFDVDGVIADTEAVNARVSIRVFADLLGIEGVAREDFEAGLGRGAQEYVRAGARTHGLELTTAEVELDRGVLGLRVSEPLRIPMERLSVKGRIGTMVLRSLGNASPKTLDVRHGVGAALVDLSGAWLRDADVDFQVTFGNGELALPDGVNIEGLDGAALRVFHSTDEEIPTPTLRVSTHSDMGDIRVVD